jgi:hypothetical protein
MCFYSTQANTFHSLLYMSLNQAQQKSIWNERCKVAVTGYMDRVLWCDIAVSQKSASP